MRQLKNFMKAKKPMWRCGECECITLKCWKENDTFCNCGTSSEGPGVEYTFKDWDGTILKQWSIGEWATPKAPADPTREGYTFTWWEPEVGPLSKDTTYVAQYELEWNAVVITCEWGWTVDTPIVAGLPNWYEFLNDWLHSWINDDDGNTYMDIYATPEEWYQWYNTLGYNEEEQDWEIIYQEVVPIDWILNVKIVFTENE